MLPISLRTAKSELAYKNAKESGQLEDLNTVEPIETFTHWKIIPNKYPYDLAYKRCHMLLPRRPVAEHKDLTAEELAEFDFLRTYIYEEYDQMIENCPSKRSVNYVYHVHLVNFYDRRGEMAL